MMPPEVARLLADRVQYLRLGGLSWQDAVIRVRALWPVPFSPWPRPANYRERIFRGGRSPCGT